MPTKAISSAAAAASSTTIVVLPQPSSLPRSSASTSRNRPEASVAWPSQSTRGARGSRDSPTCERVITRQAMPIGRLMRKIHCQPRPQVSAPPTAGPMANVPPMVAP